MVCYAVIDLCEWRDLQRGGCAEEIRLFPTREDAERVARDTAQDLCDYEDGAVMVAQIDVSNAVKFGMEITSSPMELD